MNIQGGRLNPRPRLSYMHSIPITELSPHKLKQPPLDNLVDKLMQQKNAVAKKKKRKGKKKKKTVRKTLPPITLNAPCLENLGQVPNENNKTNENGQINEKNGGKPRDQNEEIYNNQHQKPHFQQPFENKLPGDEEEYLDLEINDIQEAHELNDLIEEEIKKITEQKENIAELGHHLKQENNVFFDQSKIPSKINKNSKESPGNVEEDIFYSTLKTYNKMKSGIRNQKDEEFSLLNQVIQDRMQELEKKKSDLNNFKIKLKECIETENKLEDDDYANTLDEEFSRVKAENDFLKAYKNIKDEDKELASPGLSKLKASIMKETYDLQETKKHLKKIRKKIEGKEENKITDDEIDKVKKGLKHELVGMMSSIRNSNNLLDFNKM